MCVFVSIARCHKKPLISIAGEWFLRDIWPLAVLAVGANDCTSSVQTCPQRSSPRTRQPQPYSVWPARRLTPPRPYLLSTKVFEHPSYVHFNVPHCLIMFGIQHYVISAYDRSVRVPIYSSVIYKYKITVHTHTHTHTFVLLDVGFQSSSENWRARVSNYC